MDVELLSRMVGELVLDHDMVGLPGLGAFVCDYVPASFSDRGFTLNPPYRRIAFHPCRTDDNSLVEAYAAANDVPAEEARAIIAHYVSELSEVLKDKKSVSLPGLGKLRTTLGGNVFFVADEDADIFPEGCGLHAVSLRAHPAADHPEAPVTVPAEAPEVPVTPEVHLAPEAVPVPLATPEKKRRSRWWIAPVSVIAVAAVALAVFVILSRVAPDFTDSLLYTPEELRIINL